MLEFVSAPAVVAVVCCSLTEFAGLASVSWMREAAVTAPCRQE